MRKILLFFLDKLGFNALFRFLNRHKVLVLAYHGICEEDFTLLKGYDERHIPVSSFRTQIDFLKRKGYKFARVTDLLAEIATKKKADRLAVLTFDDGFNNVVKNAYPILKEFDACGTFYLVSGLISKNDLLWTDYVETVIRQHNDTMFEFFYENELIQYDIESPEKRNQAMLDIKKKLKSCANYKRKEYLKQFQTNEVKKPEEFLFATWSKIENLDRQVLEIGGHTMTHPICTNLDIETEFETELGQSKKDIEARIGYSLEHFCYPGGAFNNAIIDKLKQLGYKSGASSIVELHRHEQDIWAIRRIFADPDFLLFKSQICGSFFFLSKCKSLFQGLLKSINRV